MWTGNAGAATRTATKLWNDPEYNNPRSGLVSASESLCRGLGSMWFTERFHRNALVTHFQHCQVFSTARHLKDYLSPAADFINARPRGDTQLMWLRLRSTSSVPTMLTPRDTPAALA